ncbi:MAG: hypothetical protein WBD31_25745 [Rubripirellula sp.]
MRRFASKLIWLIILATIVGYLIYGFLPKPVEVEVAAPTIGSLQISVDDDGETRIREKYIISAPVTGKMLRVDLHAGDEVIAGVTEIARIEPSDPSLLDARTRAEAEARVRVATAAYSQSTTAVDRAKETLELAKQDFERAKKLIKAEPFRKPNTMPLKTVCDSLTPTCVQPNPRSVLLATKSIKLRPLLTTSRPRSIPPKKTSSKWSRQSMEKCWKSIAKIQA